MLTRTIVQQSIKSVYKNNSKNFFNTVKNSSSKNSSVVSKRFFSGGVQNGGSKLGGWSKGGVIRRINKVKTKRDNEIGSNLRGKSASLPISKSLGAVGIGLSAFGVAGLYTYGMTAATTQQTYADYIRSRVSSTYTYVAGGLGATALFGTLAWNSPFLQLSMKHPLAFGIAGMIGSIGCAMGVRMIPKEQKFLKNATFLGLTAFMGAMLCPMGFYGGPILIKAAAATAAVVGSLTLVAGAAPSQSFLNLAGPLSIGLGLLIAVSLGSMFFPASPMLQNIMLYGGLAIFSGFTLVDTQRLVERAKYAPSWDPINESISLYYNFINIFIRIAQIMAMNNSKRK